MFLCFVTLSLTVNCRARVEYEAVFVALPKRYPHIWELEQHFLHRWVKVARQLYNIVHMHWLLYCSQSDNKSSSKRLQAG